MIKFFRRIRQRLLSENPPAGRAGKFSKYLLYAIGEIILVVIGILIALQFNNWNIDKAERDREVKYLKNIVLDLEKDIASLEYLIEFRKGRIIGDQELIDHMNGKSIDDIGRLTNNVVNSLMEERFTPNNSTFSELANSGNLSLISNDSIKILLLDLNEVYKINEFGVAHEEFDYREYISKPIVNLTNTNRLYPVFSGETTVEEQQITIDDFGQLFDSRTYQNGLYIMVTMSRAFIPSYEEIKEKSQRVIEMICEDLKDHK